MRVGVGRIGDAVSVRGDLKKLIRVAVRAGWECTPEYQRFRLKSPQGHVIMATNAPRSNTAAFNLQRDLRRAGLQI